ncbi:MAG: efflux RND transporter periplasmic adaptor subunit [Croceibacterium sp.]
MNDYSAISVGQQLAQLDDRPPPAKRATSRRLLWASLVAVAVAVAWLVLRGEPAPAAAPPVPLVIVATPLQRQITEWDDYVGRFEAAKSVEVRPRVSGQIVAVHFTDGQFVRQGQPLFTIDARPYRAALAEAQAGVATAQSDYVLAQSDLARALSLVAEDAVAKSEIDSLRAHVRAAEAARAGAQARVRSRSLDVEFATVRAPMSGRISDRRVDAGNLVAAGDGPAATLLTTINSTDPIHFVFDGSEGLFLKTKRGGTGGGSPVDIRLQDESDYRWHGALDFTDNGLDPRSGTIRARAVLRNPQNFLTPGMFGNMRVAGEGQVAALLVPDTAVQADQARKILLVAAPDGTVTAKPVTLGPLVDGLRVIREGIAATDRVIIEGSQMAMPGSKVKTRLQRIEQPKAIPAAAFAKSPPGEATFAN